MTWDYVQTYDEYYDFDKVVLQTDDDGATSLDVRLTFNVETHTAYMTVMWKNDDGNTDDTHHDRYIEWGAAMRLLGDTPIPEELK